MNDEPIFVLDETQETCNAIIFILENHYGADALDQGINRALCSLLASYTSGRRPADRFLVASQEWLLDKLGEIFGDEAEQKLQGGSPFLIYVTQQKGKH